MPIDPDHATFINLDRGEQIIIEKDTDYQWRPKEGKHPMSGLKLEAGGSCIYYHLEDGVWCCSEYQGDSSATPQFKIKFEESESETSAREAAKAGWESRMGGNVGTNAAGVGIRCPTVAEREFSTGPNGRTGSYRKDRVMSMPEPAVAAMRPGYGPEFPKAPIQPQEPVYIPQATANMQQSTWQQRSPNFGCPVQFPLAGVGAGGRSTEQSYPTNIYDPIQRKTTPEPSSLPPFFPTVPATSSPSFPCPTPFFGQGSMSSLPSTSSIHQSGGRMIINDGDFLHAGGDINDMSTRDAVSISGGGRTLDWNSDLHQELNGTYSVP